jgi:methanogenic corrinoid protein MtbC1
MARSRKAQVVAGGDGMLSIGALSRATRVPVETIRTWELRYGSPAPARKPSGHRLYSAETVEHLRRVGRLLVRGHRPAELLRLSVPELDQLLSLSEPLAPAVAGAQEPHEVDAAWTGRTIDRLMRAALHLDRRGIMQELQSSWVRLGPLRFLEEVAAEFMVRVGRAWGDGDVEIRHEHLASACLSDFLRNVREPFDQQARGPHVVATMLPGDRHEGGLLMLSILLALRGYRVLYLGLDTPVAQIAATARVGGAEAVALSVSAAMSREGAASDLAALRKALPRRVHLWVGGAGAPAPIHGVERFATLTALDERLRPGT